jgi:hypothetical protein
MLDYYYSMHNNGIGSEKLGSDKFDSDAEATAFGKQVVDDLMREEPKRYTDWTMEISEGTRTVSSISFNACSD